MSSLSAVVVGEGPCVVLLHGVGVGPDSFDRMVDLLAPDHRVAVVARPGDHRHGVPVDQQADRVADALVKLDLAGARVVGVSGGATLALALAIRHPEVVGSTVAHEPLVGLHAPGLHEMFRAAAERAARSDADALAVVRQVLGTETWDRLTPGDRGAIEAESSRARHEVPLFAAFDPDLDELASLRSRPLLTTVGSRSGAVRAEAAEVLAAAGAEVATIADCGNAAQLDAPDALSERVRSWRPVQAGCGA